MKISIIIPSLLDYDELNKKCEDAYYKTAHKPDEVEVLVVAKNHPFAQNVNEGLRQATGEILVISNNDATPLPGWQDHLHRMYAKVKGIYTFTPKPDCGFLWAMARNVLEKVGFLDERLVNSFEEVDYFIRAALHGYARYMASKYFATHEGGHTLNKVWGKKEEQSTARMEQCNENMEYMKMKWPNVDIAHVQHLYWAVHCLEIMNEWKKKYGVSTNRTK